MWQTVITVLIVTVAAAWVGRRFYRSLRGRGPTCCGDAPGGGSCAGCGPAPPQGLDTLAPPQACPHCQTQPVAGEGPATPPAPKGEQG